MHPIIRDRNGTELYKDRLIYKGNSYAVSEMDHAAVKPGGFFGVPQLLITFKNGVTYTFKLKGVSNGAYANAALSGFLIDTVSTEQKAAVNQWATTINTLIALRSG